MKATHVPTRYPALTLDRMLHLARHLHDGQSRYVMTFSGRLDTARMTRTFELAPTPKQSKILKIVKSAQAAALKKVRDGVAAREVDAAARDFISRAGYGKFFNHGTGHGVGMEIHESPNLAPTSKDVLHKGMVVTVEPGIYIPKVGGARWEDTVLVKKKGYDSLTC